MEKKPVYVGIFLDAPSRRDLLGAVRPRFPNLFADHATLAFGKKMTQAYPLKKEIWLAVWKEYYDKSGQAVQCSFLDEMGLLDSEQNLHITISCADGIRPTYSNILLREPESSNLWLNPPLILSGQVDYFPRTF